MDHRESKGLVFHRFVKQGPEPEKCKSYVLLPQSVFSEVRKTRIKEQVGEPIKVQSSGDVWLGAGNKDKFVKIFVRK